MSDKNQTIEKLEVEDEEARIQRIQSTLEKLNAPSSPPAAPSPSFTLPTERSKPQAMPPSDLLSRVQAFLPTLEASNAVLQQQFQNDPSSVDIEHIEETEQYIEMNLGLGVFEQRGSHPDVGSEDDSMSSSSSDSDSDSDSDSGDEPSGGSENSASGSPRADDSRAEEA
ncbi:hypothetical protein FPV67DRAFT_1668715 [Lyophyllum atratum]|nr:hypothetical protein FPV67DRAFT_1668715 [Lyophyllum atratum]